MLEIIVVTFLSIQGKKKKIAVVIICPLDNGQIFLSGPTWSLECTGNAHPGLQRRKSLSLDRPGLRSSCTFKYIAGQQ